MTDETKYAVAEKVHDSREYIIIASFAFYDDAKEYYQNLTKYEDLDISKFKIVEK